MAPRIEPVVTRQTSADEVELLRVMSTDLAGDENARKRATLILRMLAGETFRMAFAGAGITRATARRVLSAYNDNGWQAFVTVMAPRGGDFLARYDQGFWAERLVLRCLDKSRDFRAIPYGTSRSEPFTDLAAFRAYRLNEFLLQAWSSGGRWKRPDLLSIPRQVLREEKGNDTWTPDLKHLANEHCAAYVLKAASAVEVETSLWQVKVALQANVGLSFTVKEEDLESLRNWVNANKVPLYIIQVFYDQAHVLAFSKLEVLLALPANDPRRIVAEVDPTTNKATFKVPLSEGYLLGSIPEPDVEGRVFKAPNGRVTVYGRLTGSEIVVSDDKLLERIVNGTLDA